MVPRGLSFRIPAMAAIAVLAAAHPPESSVATLIAVVRRAVARQESDGKLAGEIRKIRLAQRLDDHVIEELESEGAGPKSVAEMLDLRDLSAGLPQPAALPDFPEPPLPMRTEQDSILRSAAVNAINYSAGLPDFMCTEVVHRYEDMGGTGKWKSRDVLQVTLSYFEHQEEYKLTAINGHATTRAYDSYSVGGALSEGEFGTDLAALFLPKSKTEIRWDHWTHLRRRVAHVFFFRIAAANSQFRMEYGTGSDSRVSATAGQHGYFYVDRDTGQVLRINAAADLPRDFPVRKATTLLDYDFSTVAGRQFLVPLHAEIRMSTDYIFTRNQLDFTAYRKFSGESTITFDQAK
jgi:hypothetical protein